MDCAKGVNFLLTNGGRMEDYWGSNKATRPMLPSIGVPATAGTGSDAQSYALISQEQGGVKMACGDPKAKFRTVVLDPAVAATAPREVVALSGIDAVSHVVESYVSTKSNPISRRLAAAAWHRLDGALERVLEPGADEDAWGEMLLGAYLAGAAIEESMLGAAHACANPLTARFDVAHGAAIGVMLPHVMRFNAEQVGSSYEELYHEWFAHLPIMLRGAVPRDVLVLGAGDGMLIRELVKHEEVRRILHVDLDRALVELARTDPILAALNRNALDDPRVETRFRRGLPSGMVTAGGAHARLHLDLRRLCRLQQGHCRYGGGAARR